MVATARSRSSAWPANHCFNPRGGSTPVECPHSGRNITLACNNSIATTATSVYERISLEQRSAPQCLKDSSARIISESYRPHARLPPITPLPDSAVIPTHLTTSSTCPYIRFAAVSRRAIIVLSPSQSDLRYTQGSKSSRTLRRSSLSTHQISSKLLRLLRSLRRPPFLAHCYIR